MSNQDFGRRRFERKSDASGSGNSVDVKELLAAHGSTNGSVGGQRFRAILLGFAILLCFGVGYVIAMKGFGKALDRHWQEQVGYPGVEDAYKRSARTDASLERAHNDCKSRSDFVRLDKRTS